MSMNAFNIALILERKMDSSSPEIQLFVSLDGVKELGLLIPFEFCKFNSI